MLAAPSLSLSVRPSGAVHRLRKDPPGRVHFQKELAFLDIESSPALVRALEGNHCAERFIRISRRRIDRSRWIACWQRSHANKAELKVLERPEVPLHTNGFENDIRCHDKRCKISAGIRSDLGRDCCDAFLGLAKPAIVFWDYLANRLGVAGGEPRSRRPWIWNDCDMVRARQHLIDHKTGPGGETIYD